MHQRLILCAVAICAIGGVSVLQAHAAAPSDFHGNTVMVESWTGTGANDAMMLIDFGGGNHYAFGYRWDGAATGYDMLTSITTASGSTFAYDAGVDPLSSDPKKFFYAGGLLELSGTDYGWGQIIEGISYAGYSLVDDYWGTGESIQYWLSGHSGYDEDQYDEEWNWIGTITVPPMAADGANWIKPPFGSGTRALGNGFWDAYTQSDALGQTYTPTVPIPEPMTMTLLALGSVALLRRRV